MDTRLYRESNVIIFRKNRIKLQQSGIIYIIIICVFIR